jgi:hypothetical protein
LKARLTEITEVLLAERLLTSFDSQKYVDWAVDLIALGYESENLFILAGLDNEDTLVREKYFGHVIRELNLDVTIDILFLLDKYALYIAEKIIGKKIMPLVGLGIFQDIVRASDYDEKYCFFMDLQEDIDVLTDFNFTIFNTGLNKENKEQYVLEEFKIFYESSKINNCDVYNFCFCNKCGAVGKPKLRTKYQFKKPYKYSAWACSECSSDDVDFSQSAKWKIIEYVKSASKG